MKCHNTKGSDTLVKINTVIDLKNNVLAQLIIQYTTLYYQITPKKNTDDGNKLIKPISLSDTDKQLLWTGNF